MIDGEIIFYILTVAQWITMKFQVGNTAQELLKELVIT